MYLPDLFLITSHKNNYDSQLLIIYKVTFLAKLRMRKIILLIPKLTNIPNHECNQLSLQILDLFEKLVFCVVFSWSAHTSYKNCFFAYSFQIYSGTYCIFYFYSNSVCIETF